MGKERRAGGRRREGKEGLRSNFRVVVSCVGSSVCAWVLILVNLNWGLTAAGKKKVPAGASDSPMSGPFFLVDVCA